MPTTHRATTLDGIAIATAIEQTIVTAITRTVRRPGLAAILVGDNPASSLYIKLKEKAAQRTGITFHKYLLSAQPNLELGRDELLTTIAFLNQDPTIDGIIVQLPLPAGYPTDEIIAAIDPTKDADGFRAQSTSLSPTVAAVGELLINTDVPLMDRRTLLIGKSDIFLRGLHAHLADTFGISTIVEAHEIPPDSASYDTIVIALGQAHVLTKDMVKPDAIVIDVGINKLDGRTVGDVDPDVAEVAGYLTPVPGGVGPITVACLLRNTYELMLNK